MCVQTRHNTYQCQALERWSRTNLALAEGGPNEGDFETEIRKVLRNQMQIKTLTIKVMDEITIRS